jgi:membrane fusion protein, multidrug efflux system
VDEKNMVTMKPVEIGPLMGDLRVIKSGVTPEDRIIVNGLAKVRPGMPVAPEPAKPSGS